MIDSKSRYYVLERAEVTMQGGRVAAYKRRRFLPKGEEMPVLVEVEVTQEERLDLIASRTIGDPEQFWRICDANDAMNPWDLLEPGRRLRVPLPQF